MYQIYRREDCELENNGVKYPILEDAIDEAKALYENDCLERGENASNYDVVKATNLELVYTTAPDNYFINNNNK